MQIGIFDTSGIRVRPVCTKCKKEIGPIPLSHLLETQSPICPQCRATAVSAYPEWIGKREQMVVPWQDFKTFLAVVGPRPSPAHILIRRDASKPFGPKNATRWATPREKMRPSVRRKADHREHFKRRYPAEAKNFDKYWRDFGNYMPAEQGWVLTPNGWEEQAAPFILAVPSNVDELEAACIALCIKDGHSEDIAARIWAGAVKQIGYPPNIRQISPSYSRQRWEYPPEPLKDEDQYPWE
jgi:hypothetical protein